MKRIRFEEERKDKQEKIEILEDLPEEKRPTPRNREPTDVKAPSSRAERFFGFSK